MWESSNVGRKKPEDLKVGESSLVILAGQEHLATLFETVSQALLYPGQRCFSPVLPMVVRWSSRSTQATPRARNIALKSAIYLTYLPGLSNNTASIEVGWYYK